jgi:hypothetical protein
MTRFLAHAYTKDPDIPILGQVKAESAKLL